MKRIITVLVVATAGFMLLASSSAQAAFYTPKEVVSIGDSFASGDGADVVPGGVPNPAYYEQGTFTTCRRSSQAAGKQLAADLHAQSKFVACSGATTANILTTGQFEEPAQIQAVTPSASHVTLTIGGNDIGFSPIVARTVGGELTATSPEIVNANTVMDTTLPHNLNSVLSAIKSRIGSRTQVLVTGYPYIPPKSGPIGPQCAAYITPAERDVIIQLEDKLNSTIRHAVASTNDSRFKYINPTSYNSPFMKRDRVFSIATPTEPSTYGVWGRDACTLNPKSGINPLRFGLNPDGSTSTAGSFHPNIYGQDYYRQLMHSSLR